MTLDGVDVSRHQGPVNWQQVATAKHFGFTKRSEGLSLVDPRGAVNAAAMVDAGMMSGCYHFLSPTSDPAAQARKFVDLCGDMTGQLAALDVETTATGGHPTSEQAHAFAAEFARLQPGHPLILYTGRWYWRDILGNPYGADIGPLWHSAYSTSPGPLYGGWPAFTMWQHTSSGTCPGIAGTCDLNVLYGDHATLAALAGAPIDTPPSTPPPEDLMPFPVIGAPTDEMERPWRALLPGKVVTFVNWDPLPASTDIETFAPGWAYYAGGAGGTFDPMHRAGSDVEYDQAVAVAQQYTRLPAMVPADLKGEKGEKGDTGPAGPPGELPPSATATVVFDQPSG